MSFDQFPVGSFAVLAPSFTVTLSGEIIFAFSFGSLATASVIVNTDGTMDRQLNNGTPTQIDASTDWIIPNGEASSSFRVRYTNKTGDAFSFNNIGSENVYAAISTNRELSVDDNTTGAGGDTANFDLEIDDGSVSQDSGAYQLSADREDF